jgi:predicted RNase H-like HicB family nuclease
VTTAAPRVHYSLVIEWDSDDAIFVVTVPDLPGCRTHGRTYEEAARNAQDAIESWLEAARADGQEPPEPRLSKKNGAP